MTLTLRPRHGLQWALLVPLDATSLEAELRLTPVADQPVEIDEDEDEDEDGEPATWGITQGTAGYTALFETAPGSSDAERDFAAALSMKLETTIYGINVCGYDDPDKGIPTITRWHRGEEGLVFMGPLDEDEGGVETVPGPPGLPCDDPFTFAEALGCQLRSLHT